MVEASAGTGKTYNIQSAYLRLVLEGYPVTGVLVVTFTEAATAELRERLRNVLEECRAELDAPAENDNKRAQEALAWARGRGVTDAELGKRISAALALFDRAPIHTIHGFCNHVLTQYAFEAGHENDGELLQDTDDEVMDASRDWWRKNMYGEDGADNGAFAKGFKEFRAKVRQRLGHPDATIDGDGEQALDAAAAIYGRQRRERNELTFDGMLTDLRHALTIGESTELKTAVRRDFPAALIDEFQDTDSIQYVIFQKLFGEAGLPLLFVGDPKQAIYRFRGGDILAYMRAKDAIPAARRYDLGTNYRSEAPLLEAINAYFGEEHDGDTFGNPAIPYRTLASGEKERELPTLDGSVKTGFVLWTATYQSVDEMRARACEATANEIVRLLENPAATLWEPEDKKKGRPAGRRRLQPQDFAVLMQANEECETMLDVLRKRGVNAVCVRASDLQQTPAAQGMRWILRSIAAPKDIAKLRAALAVPFMPGTKADFEALTRGETPETASLWGEKLWKAGERWEKRGFLGAWKMLKAELGIQRKILELEDGEQQAADLAQVAEWLLLRGRETEGGAQGLVRAYEAWLDGGDAAGEDGDEMRKIADDAPAVKVMTIHKSKGLEFPVVFVPTLFGKTYGRKRGDGFYVYHDQDGERLGNDQRAARAEEESEGIRLAYVALTRAANRLYLVDARKVKKTEFDWKKLGGTTVASLTNAWLAQGGRGGIEEKPLPEMVGLLHAGVGEATVLEDAKSVPVMDRGNGRTSFSTMTDGMHGGRSDGGGEPETDTEDHDETDGGSSVKDDGDARTEDEVPTGIFALPGGTQTGSGIHKIFEELDFVDEAKHRETIERILKRFGLKKHRDAVEEMVETVLDTELPGGGGKLRDAKWRMAEMKFDFPMRRPTAATLKEVADVLAEHWVGEEAWKREFVEKLRASDAAGRAIARGYMTGAIDLVFLAGGKFHLADWKTNRLDGKPENFGTEGLREEMTECLYCLQYLVYLVALDGILRDWLEGYDYDKDVGNVYYLFVRGMDGAERGVFVDRPSRETIEALGKCLRGGKR